MPRTRKKVKDNAKSVSAGRAEKDPVKPEVQNRASNAALARSQQDKAGQRRRGWRDIEAISERARLKKMLVDIWHEDIELDEDIFGESDHLSGYYADFEEEELEEIEIDDDLIDDEDDFEEDEE